MIKLTDLSIQRGAKRLLDHTHLTLHHGWKTGIIGANGVGKSTFFELILGHIQPDSGDFYRPASARISYMAQEIFPGHHQTALDYVLDGDDLLRQIQQALNDAQTTHNPMRTAELHAQLEHIDGYRAEARAHQLLRGLGFASNEATKPVAEFSGGWQVRLNLARALMCQSDILLLDEPTNHLDLDATLWLESWLKTYPGSLLLISHDRDFLDNVVDHIVHMNQQQLTLYNGHYTAFERAKAERLAQQQATFVKQQERIAHIEDFIRRFKAKASKAKQAQSRIKELERMESLSPAHVDSPFSFQFTAQAKLSSPLVSLHDVSMGYGGAQPTLQPYSISITPGERIGLLGPNGAGKSTLMKTLVGDLAPLSGERVTGEHLNIGYFAQHQLDALDLDASPFLHLQRLSPQASDQAIRNFLGRFDFSGDKALEAVKHLSGGEKARVALALIAWQHPNLLLLDEPTNHLDLEVCHALTLAIQTFEGALLIVSHDRHLLRNSVDRFLLVADGVIQPFDGDLDDYQLWLTQHRRQKAQDALNASASVNALTHSDTAEQIHNTTISNLSATEKKELKRLEAEKRAALKPLRLKIEHCEKSIHAFELQLATLAEQLHDTELYNDANKAKLMLLLQQQTQVKKQLEDSEMEWMALSEELETKTT